jgi:hypothetical protein
LTFQAVYQQAREWLANSERQDVLRRLTDAAGKLVETLAGEIKTDKPTSLFLPNRSISKK